jgi:hypothetical protein
VKTVETETERNLERERERYGSIKRHAERGKLNLTAIVGKHVDAKNWFARSEVQATTLG